MGRHSFLILLAATLGSPASAQTDDQWSGLFGQQPETNITAFAPTPSGFVGAGNPVTVINSSGDTEFHVLRYYEDGQWRTTGDIGVGIVQGGPITTIIPYREDVCIGGGFTQLGPQNFSFFACYSTSGGNWYQPGGDGNGPNNAVNSVWFDGSIYLYIAGNFDDILDDQGMSLGANGIARTTGALWEVLSSDGGTTNGVGPAQVVRTFNGFVFVAHGSNVSRFNPTNMTWTPYGEARLNSNLILVDDLEFFDNEVITSGPFDTIAGVDAPGIATTPIAGTSPDWMTLDDGSQGHGSGQPEMAANSSYLYAVGPWPDLAGADGLARFSGIATGSVWEPVDTAALGDTVATSIVDVATLADNEICIRHGTFSNADLASRRVACKQEPSGPWRGTSQGIEGIPSALAEFGGELYAGGGFLSAGDDSAASVIGRWNGERWASVGAGVEGTIDSLAVFRGELYAAGSVTGAGGNTTGGLVAWNGTQWRDAGGSATLASKVWVFNNTLFFFGLGGTCGGVLFDVCRFDGTTIEAAASSGPQPVSVDVLGDYNGQLVAAGNFSFDGGGRQNVIAALDGDTWNVLIRFGSGGRALSLASDSSFLYFGGDFTTNTVGAPTALNGIGRWDGSEITALGSGVGGGFITRVLAIALRGTEVFIAGDFDTAGSDTARAIARWNGSQWDGISGGLQNGSNSGVGNALLSSEAGLYVAGDFRRSGDQWAENIGLLLGPVIYADGFETP